MSKQFESWIGREEERTDRVQASVVQAMSATLDYKQALVAGQSLPPGWHWLFFNPIAQRSELGLDGHPQRGGFLPPIDLPRRMWAGSRIKYMSELTIDGLATRRSIIRKVENKIGKRGSLWFVTVSHTISCEGKTCLVEEQDIVYREGTPVGVAPPLAAPAYEGNAQFIQNFQPDTTLLFRYSALTFNGHRIHYDQSYAKYEEGYHDLVVHGPLTATLLQQFAVDHGGGRRIASFDFRGVSPLFVDRPFNLEARNDEDGGLALWARGPDGELAMSASATFV